MGARTAAALAAAVIGVGAPAVAAAQESGPAARLRAIVEDVRGATAVRYDARDDRGVGLDGLDPVQAGGTLVGVHHALVDGRFQLAVATSEDLVTWRHRAVLDEDASQGTLVALPDRGFLVVYEKATWLSALPRVQLAPQLEALQGLVDRVNLAIRHYPSLEALLAGRHGARALLPLRVSRHAEGTPHIARVAWGGALERSVLELGFHRFADVTGDGFPDVDRQASGTLSGMSRWTPRIEPGLDRAFLRAGELHQGFRRPPSGNLGDRDGVLLDGRALVVHEAQYVRGDFATWRLFLRDPDTGTVRPLEVRTHGASRALANASVTRVDAPGGGRATLVTAFVPREGAAPGEAGTLLWYRTDRPAAAVLRGRRPATPRVRSGGAPAPAAPAPAARRRPPGRTAG